MKRPETDEYASSYAGYVDLVPESDVIAVLRDQIGELSALKEEVGEAKAGYSYAEGKWTIKQLIGHLADCERIFAYRGLRIVRRDETPLPGFEQDDYIAASRADERPIEGLLNEIILLRQANMFLFEDLNEEDWAAAGTASDNHITVRAIAFIMAGHVRHHLNILRERYLS